MRIESVRIKNLRSFADVTIPLNDYTCLVGPNGAGKSTILCALNLFFQETENTPTNTRLLDREDFHNKVTREPIEVTITFADLSEEAQNDFEDYYRQGKLIVSAIATFNEAAGKAEVKQYGVRLVMVEFQEFFRELNNRARVKELKQLYARIRESFGDLPAPGTKDSMVEALRSYEKEHPDRCVPVPSEDQFYGISKGANRLAKHLQWVYVPAVKDAMSEQVESRNTALGRLLARTVRVHTNFSDSIEELRARMRADYQEILDQNQASLEGISASLASRLEEWANPRARLRLEWRQDPDKSVRVDEPLARLIAGEGSFEGELARFGHGLQRSYLLVLLQELAGSDDGSSPRLILGCEEPELYQHPPQVRHLSAILRRLSLRNSQVVVSTHSPFFVSGEGFEDVRMVRRNIHQDEPSNVTFLSYSELADEMQSVKNGQHYRPEGILAKIHQALQPSLSEMFFASRLVIVEGLEDVAYISAYINLLDRSDDFHRLGCHIVPANGKSQLFQPLIIAKHMHIPTYLVFDSDADEKKQDRIEQHRKDNLALLTLLGHPSEDPMPRRSLWGNGFVMWPSNIGAVVEDDMGSADWRAFQAEADQQYGQVGDLKKNTLHIWATLQKAWDAGKRSASLERLCNEILDPLRTIEFPTSPLTNTGAAHPHMNTNLPVPRKGARFGARADSRQNAGKFASE